MNKKILRKLLIVFVLSMICFCIVGAFIPAVAARDSFAPAWLKEGTYATYATNQESAASIFETSNPQYGGLNCWNASAYDVLSYWNAALTWRCININDTVAKLHITFDYIGKELIHNVGEVKRESLNNASLQLTGEVYVDLYTRAVYTSDGTLLGTTQLWAPANPTEGQEITVWAIGSEIVTIPAQVNNVWFETTQRKQEGFMVGGTETINGKSTNFDLTCDLNTGVNVGSLQWDPVMAAIGIRMGNLDAFSDTNINLGSDDTSLNWTVILQYTILPIAIVLISVAVLYARKKKTK